MDRLTNAEFDKMIIESIDTVWCLDKDTDDILFFFDQVKSGEITSESDVVYAEGRQGVQLAAFDRNKTAGFTCENGYVQAGAIAVQLGSDLVNGTDSNKVAYEIFETITGVEGETATEYVFEDNYKTVDGVFLVGDDGTAQGKLDATDYTAGHKTVGTGSEARTVGYVSITPGSGETAPEKLIVHYTAETATGKKIINAGDKFSKNIKLVIDFVAQEPCGGNKYLMQCVMPNAKASGTFSLSAGDDPAVHNFEASALLDVCSQDKELFYIVMV